MWQLLGSSSMVHSRSTPVPIPDHTHGVTFSQTLNTKALYPSTFGWFEAPSCKAIPVGRFHHLIYSMQWILYCRPLLLGTLWNVAHFKALHFQTDKPPIKCYVAQFTTFCAMFYDTVFTASFFHTSIGVSLFELKLKSLFGTLLKITSFIVKSKFSCDQKISNNEISQWLFSFVRI